MTRGRIYAKLPSEELYVTLTHFEYAPGAKKKAYPLVVFFHDGRWDNPEQFQTGLYSELSDVLRVAKDRFLAQGYAVASCQYLSKHAPNTWPEPVNRATLLLRFLANKAPEFNIDPDRIVLMGEGAGAHTALTAALEVTRTDTENVPVDVRAVVALSVLTDLEAFARYPGAATAYPALYQSVQDYLNSPLSENAPPPEIYKTAAPVNRLHRNMPHVFVFAPEDPLYDEQATALVTAFEAMPDLPDAEVSKRQASPDPAEMFQKISEFRQYF